MYKDRWGKWEGWQTYSVKANVVGSRVEFCCETTLGQEEELPFHWDEIYGHVDKWMGGWVGIDKAEKRNEAPIKRWDSPLNG